MLNADACDDIHDELVQTIYRLQFYPKFYFDPKFRNAACN